MNLKFSQPCRILMGGSEAILNKFLQKNPSFRCNQKLQSSLFHNRFCIIKVDKKPYHTNLSFLKNGTTFFVIQLEKRSPAVQ